MPEIASELVTHCEEAGAQEPWFAPPLPGFELGGERWLRPTEFAAEMEFGGSALLHTSASSEGTTTTRRHHVKTAGGGGPGGLLPRVARALRGHERR
jgi:hypothetical protein